MRSITHRPRLPRFTLPAVAFFVVMAVFSGTPGRAQVGGADRQYTLKAAYLYKFATYTTWPKTTFTDSSSPYVIAIFGPDPVSKALRKIAAVKAIDGRPIEVRHFEQLSDVRDCHILFMAKALDSELQEAAIQQLSGRHILFVGETNEFLRQGGVIVFVIRDNRIGLYVSRPAYERESLKISAHLLRVATVLD